MGIHSQSILDAKQTNAITNTSQLNMFSRLSLDDCCLKWQSMVIFSPRPWLTSSSPPTTCQLNMGFGVIRGSEVPTLKLCFVYKRKVHHWWKRKWRDAVICVHINLDSHREREPGRRVEHKIWQTKSLVTCVQIHLQVDKAFPNISRPTVQWRQEMHLFPVQQVI